jgi:hypothetical protein
VPQETLASDQLAERLQTVEGHLVDLCERITNLEPSTAFVDVQIAAGVMNDLLELPAWEDLQALPLV